MYKWFLKDHFTILSKRGRRDLPQRTNHNRVENSEDDDALISVCRKKTQLLHDNITISIRNDVDFMEESNGSYSLSHCSKNHGHHGFIPVSELKLDCLPPGNRSSDLLRYIRCVSGAVVKVTVHFVSKQRHQLFPGFENSRSLRRQGTGWVGHMSYDDDIETIPCSDSNCTVEDNHDVIGPFYVITANHLVFDKSEAVATTVQFNDGDDSGLAWTAFGVDIAYTEDEKRDVVFVKCYSHDLDIIPRLVTISENIAKAVDNLYQDNQESDTRSLGFIISHPHGREKHISFGKCFGKLRKEKAHESERDLEFDIETGQKRAGIVKYTYDIPTCPGSSGAPVCIMGKDGAYYYLAPHSCREGGEGGCADVLVERREPEKELYPCIRDPSPLPNKLRILLIS